MQDVNELMPVGFVVPLVTLMILPRVVVVSCNRLGGLQQFSLEYDFIVGAWSGSAVDCF
jgi:hypothetical protein